jgi:NAD-dependent dihydropyrimidine dehydrogenase PreA subunit
VGQVFGLASSLARLLHVWLLSQREKVIAVVYVDEIRCTGCGLCTDVCPTGAIRVVNGVARVEQSLCRECETCLLACPTGAILALREPTQAEKPTHLPAPMPFPVRPMAPAPRTTTSMRPWLGAALAFVGRGGGRRARRGHLRQRGSHGRLHRHGCTETDTLFG